MRVKGAKIYEILKQKQNRNNYMYDSMGWHQKIEEFNPFLLFLFQFKWNFFPGSCVN